MHPRERAFGSCVWSCSVASFALLWLGPAVVLACTATPAAPTCGVAASCLISHQGSVVRGEQGVVEEVPVKVHTMLSFEGSDPRCGKVQGSVAVLELESSCWDIDGGARHVARESSLFTLPLRPATFDQVAPLPVDEVSASCAIGGRFDVVLAEHHLLSMTCEPALLTVEQEPSLEVAITPSQNTDVVKLRPGTLFPLNVELVNSGTERVDGQLQFLLEPVEQPLNLVTLPRDVHGLCHEREADPPVAHEDCAGKPAEPVCGCDGNFYPSVCVLNNAGVEDTPDVALCRSRFPDNSFAITGRGERQREIVYEFRDLANTLCTEEGCDTSKVNAAILPGERQNTPVYLGVRGDAPAGGLYQLKLSFMGSTVSSAQPVRRVSTLPVWLDATVPSDVNYGDRALLDMCDRFDCCPLLACSPDDVHCDARTDADCDGLHIDYDPSPRVRDVDGDGLYGLMEVLHGTDPARSDTDGDGLTDGQEVIFGTDVAVQDSDGDGLTDAEEVGRGTNPNRGDSDLDGLLDGEDPAPWSADADGDGLFDREDDAPFDPDRDGDGLLDGEDPWVLSDQDGDGLSDGFEVSNGFDPADANDPEDVAMYLGMPGATAQDSDADGVSDASEVFVYGSDPEVADTDGDGLTDGQEVAWPMLDPTRLDTDGDGLSDGVEANLGSDPRQRDSDHDGASDADEILRLRSDPRAQDTDGSGVWDGDEMRHGFDPLDGEDDFEASRVVQPHAMIRMPDAGTMYGHRDGALAGLDVRRTTSRVEVYAGGGRARLIVRYELFPVQPVRPSEFDLHQVHYLVASGVDFIEITDSSLLESSGEEGTLELELAGKGQHGDGKFRHDLSLHLRASLWAYHGEQVTRTSLTGGDVGLENGSDLVDFWDLVPAGHVSVFTARTVEDADAYELVIDVHVTEAQYPNTELDCFDGQDNDRDGLVDSSDPDCPPLVEVCNNGFDDDADGLVDLSDPDCSTYVGGELCANRTDDDGDGLIDCSDPDCSHDEDLCPYSPPVCANGCPCEGPDCPPEKKDREICGDCIDNDLDGLTDCEEIKCRLLPMCRMETDPCDDVIPPGPPGCCGTCSAAPPSLPIAPALLALLALFGLRSRRVR